MTICRVGWAETSVAAMGCWPGAAVHRYRPPPRGCERIVYNERVSRECHCCLSSTPTPAPSTACPHSFVAHNGMPHMLGPARVPVVAPGQHPLRSVPVLSRPPAHSRCPPQATSSTRAVCRPLSTNGSPPRTTQTRTTTTPPLIPSARPAGRPSNSVSALPTASDLPADVRCPAVAPHALARIPPDLRTACHPALRRVFLASASDADSDTARREMDLLYARVGQLQGSLQQAREKEQGAEGRLQSIMELWKREQARNAELQRILQSTSHGCHAVKPTAKADVPAPAPPPLPPMPSVASVAEHGFLAQASP